MDSIVVKINSTFKSVVYVIFAATLLLSPAPVQAQYKNASIQPDLAKPKKLGLKYDIYAGGFRALDALLELDLDKKAYDMALEAKTQGFIGDLFPWKASYTTSGHTDDHGDLVPTTHISRSTWKKSEKLTEMDFDPNGKLLKMTTQKGDKTTVERDIDQKLAGDAVDMLTGVLMMFKNAENTDKCAGSFPVFDGKRRFNITMKDDGQENLIKSDYSSFEGRALRCTVRVEPVAGFDKKDAKRGWMAVQAHTEKRNKPTTIWLAPVEKEGTVVPVRMEISSDYGTVVAHLTNAGKK